MKPNHSPHPHLDREVKMCQDSLKDGTFNLSDERYGYGHLDPCYLEKDVKTFIKKLKEDLHKEIPSLREGWGMTVDGVIDKRAGEELTK